jgi:hypothetical protein
MTAFMLLQRILSSYHGINLRNLDRSTHDLGYSVEKKEMVQVQLTWKEPERPGVMMIKGMAFRVRNP